jgi:hypothetical protein
MNQDDKKRVVFYGFDKLGFKHPNQLKNVPNTSIQFINYTDPARIDSCDVLVFPSGIFEEIRIHSNFNGTFANVTCDSDLLLERERQVFNLIQKNKYVIVLVRTVIDEVPNGSYQTKEIKKTDLCKKLLNGLGLMRSSISGNSYVEPKYQEFVNYFNSFGVAHTKFVIYNQQIDTRIISQSEREIYALEVIDKVIFLPFHTTNFDGHNLDLLIQTLIPAVIDFRQKMSAEIPGWVNEIKFKNEVLINTEIESALEKLEQLEKQIEVYRSYKSILVYSGELLRLKIVDIFKYYFGFRIESTDNFVEDARVLDEKGNILFLIEVKGSKKGVKREHINQADSHRERNELSSTVKSILVINNEMDIIGIVNKQNTSIADEQLKHAINSNVIVIRTIDLLNLMIKMEEIENKSQVFLQQLEIQKGWFKDLI